MTYALADDQELHGGVDSQDEADVIRALADGGKADLRNAFDLNLSDERLLKLAQRWAAFVEADRSMKPLAATLVMSTLSDIFGDTVRDYAGDK